ncbi:uncharacterized protein [Diadema antillarum]|uniref:uncharacterized protein n=1 Tax=Diadema antillarum TaxID=105358 RepID=UPI003A849FA8
MAKPVSMMDSISKDFECSICMERLRDARFLFCQHTFCSQCLQSYVQSGRESANHITCPVCREVTRLPRGGVGGLKSSALINSVLEKLGEWEKRNGTESSGVEGSQYCSEHPRTIVKHYCTDCDRLCCSKCISMGRHKTVQLQQKAADVKRTMGQLVDQCQEKNFVIQTAHHQVNTNKDQGLEALNSLKVEVQRKAEKLRLKIKTQEEELLHRLDAMKEKVRDTMAVKQRSCCELEDDLQDALQEWMSLRQSGNDAEIVSKHSAILSRMKGLLKVGVTPGDVECQLLERCLHFVPGELYLQMAGGANLGELCMARSWNTVDVTASGIVSKLMYKSDGKLVIGYLNNGVEILEQDHSQSASMLENRHFRDLTVLANDDIVLQDDENELFLVRDSDDEISDNLGMFAGQWVSVTTCTSVGVNKRSSVVVANKDMHNQNIINIDTRGKVITNHATSYFHGFYHMCCDRNRRVLFIDYDRKGIHWPDLKNKGPEKLLIAEEGRVYLAVACNQSNFVYAAWQNADTPNKISITQHSLDDGRQVRTILSGYRVKNSFRMTLANWGDQELAFSTGGDLTILQALKNLQAASLLSQF